MSQPTYTIGQIADKFNLSISTLRYYDKEGLFPNIKRQSGIRRFSKNEIETLRLIECLKASGLEIKDIKQFIDWTLKGPSTYEQRKQLFETRKKIIEKEMERLQKIHNVLEFKCWYYDTAIKDGNEDRLQQMLPDGLPITIQELYNKGHK